MVRLLGAAAQQAPTSLQVSLLLDGRALERTVPLARGGADDEKRVRRAAWEQLLATQVATLRQHEDPKLRQEIIDASVREGVPCELTALQVDVPAPAASSSRFVGSSAPEPASWAALLLVVAVAVLTWRNARSAPKRV